LGVIGGGQLGRMFAMAAHRLGYRVAVLDPDRDCPAAGVANIHVCAALDDRDAWRSLADECAALTIETESAPAEALKYFSTRMPVAPGERALYITQDRTREKHFLATNGFATAPYREIKTPADAERQGIDALLPGLLKASRFGYDGKGQHVVRSRRELARAAQQLGGPGVLEQRVELAAELLRRMPRKLPPDTSKFLLSPMPGLLVNVAVTPGQVVQPGERLVVIEAMKMQNTLHAERVSTIAEVLAEQGTSLAVDQPILRFS
ncbi:MAG: biotin/lipoyl-containing protein, partial [Verrucomicrobiota bacterium]